MPVENATMNSELQESSQFFVSHHWPMATMLVYVAFSAAAFTPRFIEFLATGTWGQSVTRTSEFAPNALNAHALFGMALIPLFLLQPLLGAGLMRRATPLTMKLAHQWHGRFLVLSAGLLSVIGFYITYLFGMNSDSITSVIFMFLVALFVILFFAQAIWEARNRRIDRHLDALVFAMIFLSVPATGRLIEVVMRAVGVENTRSRDIVSVGFGYQVELVDITILMIASVPIVLWGIYAIPRSVFREHPAKLWIAAAFFGLPFLAVMAQTLGR